MKFYSDFPARRLRQVTTDLVAIVAIAAWIWLGSFVYGLVQNLAAFGVQMEKAGSGFTSTMADISKKLGSVPLIGSGIRAPFDGASDAGSSLEHAGQAQQVAVHDLALGLGIGIAAVPVLTILLVWLVPRIRFARRASVARAVAAEPASVDLLALRALAGQKLRTIAAIHPDAVSAWRNGDQDVIRALATLELKSAGVRLR